MTLYSEDYYLDALTPLGMTRRGFRAWLRALQVPTLEIGSVRYLDPWTFNLALKVIMRIGQPDFFAPGSMGLRRGSHEGVSTLAPEVFERNVRYAIAELVSSKARPFNPPPPKVRKAAELAAQRMADMGMQYLPSLLALRQAERETKHQRIPTLVN